MGKKSSQYKVHDQACSHWATGLQLFWGTLETRMDHASEQSQLRDKAAEEMTKCAQSLVESCSQEVLIHQHFLHAPSVGKMGSSGQREPLGKVGSWKSGQHAWKCYIPKGYGKSLTVAATTGNRTLCIKCRYVASLVTLSCHSAWPQLADSESSLQMGQKLFQFTLPLLPSFRCPVPPSHTPCRAPALPMLYLISIVSDSVHPIPSDDWAGNVTTVPGYYFIGCSRMKQNLLLKILS